MSAQWTETMAGGSAEAERRLFEGLARDIMRVQLTSAKVAGSHGVPHGVDRAFHAKSTLATDDAELRFLDLPADLRHGFASPGATYPVTVRFSNASPVGHPDTAPDLRGVALRIRVGSDESHDLLMTNFPVSHARDAHQFVEFAKATAGGTVAKVFGLLRLVRLFGPRETVRMLRNVTTGRRRKVPSIATETYWSRGALRWGPELAVRYLLRPAPATPPAPDIPRDDPSYLSTEVARRLLDADVRFELCVQRYVDERSTPIEDTAVEWTERVSPPEPVAVLTLHRGDVTTVEAIARARVVEGLAFNPWNTTEEFRPLGNLNRARRAAYDASSGHRLGFKWETTTPLRNVVVGGAARAFFRGLNRYVEWHRLPKRLGLLNLEAFRYVLRSKNLIDTEPADEGPPTVRPVPPSPPGEEDRIARTVEGTGNDLSSPGMGSVGATFGRNLAADLRPDLFDEPNPIEVSQRLLYREHFIPARSLNLLAASWIQFQVHDWVSHARHPLGVDDVTVRLPEGMVWSNTPGGAPEQQMRIAGNVPSPGPTNGSGPVFANSTSHWWDGSEVYGADSKRAGMLREGAKLRLTHEGYLPEDASGQEMTGFNESWWLGLSSLHTLFAREHNLLCDELRSHYRGWSDDRVYQTARLIVSALIAKIHTVEWTPAILATEVIDIGLKSNWNGPPAHDWLTKLGIWLVDSRAGKGIPQTKPDHNGVPYSLTEDFATVYRLHPLIPDDYRFVDHASGAELGRRDFLDIQGAATDEQLRSFGLENSLYSFGIAHPGAITLHNFPRALQRFERNGEVIDLSVLDLVRTRRRGVPRYNDFRAGLHKPRLTGWEQLAVDAESVRRMREVYRSIDEVDTVVGLLGEAPPEGFGFSDTAFRIFILMASRRLQSDRFLTVDFRPEIYSPLGMDWVATNGMTSLILRHCPDLAGVLPREGSAFAPWRPVPASASMSRERAGGAS